MNDLYHIDENSKWEMVLGNIKYLKLLLVMDSLHYEIVLFCIVPAFCVR